MFWSNLPFTTDEASAAEEAGIDTLKVRFDPAQPENAAAIRKAAPNTFMAFCTTNRMRKPGGGCEIGL